MNNYSEWELKELERLYALVFGLNNGLPHTGGAQCRC